MDCVKGVHFITFFEIEMLLINTAEQLGVTDGHRGNTPTVMGNKHKNGYFKLLIYFCYKLLISVIKFNEMHPIHIYIYIYIYIYMYRF